MQPAPWRIANQIRRYGRCFLLGTAAAFVLRFFFVFKFRHLAGDTFIYGDIAKNWLEHGVFGMSEAAGVVPTYIRLPGYPAFLAAVFAVFGMEHYTAVMVVQIFVDVGTCFVIADLAGRLAGERTGRAAFLLAALCPFTANYVALPLTETLSFFSAALALDFAVAALDSRSLKLWTASGAAVAAGILLRPDGGILLAAIAGYLALRFLLGPQRKHTLMAGLMLMAASLTPLIPWAIRNWRDFHEFQPLAPRYANTPGEFVPLGWTRWVKTWIADYVSVEEVFWAVSGDRIPLEKLPARAFDNEQERRRTEALVASYNELLFMSSHLDEEFGALAQERVRRAPLRYYLWLPALRGLSMWLRPRTEMLPLSPRWWQVRVDARDSACSMLLGAIGVLYAGAAVWGFTRGRVRYAGLLLGFVVLRTLFLMTLENPEPRYTLECFPVVLVFAAVAVAQVLAAMPSGRNRMDTPRHASIT